MTICYIYIYLMTILIWIMKWIGFCFTITTMIEYFALLDFADGADGGLWEPMGLWAYGVWASLCFCVALCFQLHAT